VQLNGETFWMRGGKLFPVTRKKKVIETVNADGTKGPDLPVLPKETMEMVIGFLERAFSANQDPEVVAQSYRAQVPDEVLQVIRIHGMDTFLGKMANVPGGSPLATQRGLNWIRKVGAALVE
jgi:hypothetical protein